MSDDIAKRLRTVLPCWCDDSPTRWEIQAERYEAAAEIERLRAAGDALHGAYQQHGTAGWSKTISQAKAIRAWEEARRG